MSTFFSEGSIIVRFEMYFDEAATDVKAVSVQDTLHTLLTVDDPFNLGSNGTVDVSNTYVTGEFSVFFAGHT